VFAAGGLTATYDTGTKATLSFNFSDWLGSKRLQSNFNGATQNSWASDPFGDYLKAQGSGADATEHHFTGKERDSESGNDYFGARYYESGIGRFISVDPITITQTRLGDPQRLDLYVYALDNPRKYVDARGKDVYLAGNTEEERKINLYSATQDLTVPEQRNIGYRTNAVGKYELFVKNPSKIDPATASAGYKYLTGLINSSLKVNFDLVQKGGFAVGFDGAKWSYHELARPGGEGGINIYYGNGNIDVFVPQGKPIRC
jgi:RHS repeat-associated protein